MNILLFENILFRKFSKSYCSYVSKSVVVIFLYYFLNVPLCICVKHFLTRNVKKSLRNLDLEAIINFRVVT